MSADGTFYQEALTGSYRYIKILLLNAKSTPLSKSDSIEYKTAINSHSNVSDPDVYSHTAIAEISVFGTGKTDIDSLVNTDNTDAPQGISIQLIPVIIVGAVALILVVVTFIVTKKKKTEDK